MVCVLHWGSEMGSLFWQQPKGSIELYGIYIDAKVLVCRSPCKVHMYTTRLRGAFGPIWMSMSAF